MNNNRSSLVWIPLIIAVSIVIGLFFGNNFSNKTFISDNDRKLNTILNLVSAQYVDTVDINDLIEQSIPKILANLDPHTTYIPANEFNKVNSELEGSISGIGVSFSLMNDTVVVNEVVSGGPSEKVGIMTGDRIISVNDSSLINVKDTEVMQRLRGARNSKVKLGVKRSNSPNTIFFTVTRGDIPIHTIDASYMIEKTTGYIRVNKFGKNSYNEFLSALIELQKEGANRYIIDLRGNGGGLMEPAILMANEFLGENHLIVFTKGREKRNESQFWSDGNGSFKDVQLVVLIDEYSASASEIFSGAIQDNDRGLIIGRRSFGKGLIQQQISLPDSSAVRLTVGRYYTPSGRCIQKDFKRGNDDEYSLELYDRYTSGEVYNKDSIKVKTDQVFITSTGRTVYGGGGIIPDIFVPNDTSGITSYYINVVNANMMQRFAMQYCDINREAIAEMADYNELMSCMPSNDALLSDFVRFASQHGIPARWYYINISRNLIINQLRALIARDAFGNQAFYQVFNTADKTVAEAIKVLKSGKAEFPIVDEQESEKKSKK